jgi:hypothetical protein
MLDVDRRFLTRKEDSRIYLPAVLVAAPVGWGLPRLKRHTMGVDRAGMDVHDGAVEFPVTRRTLLLSS